MAVSELDRPEGIKYFTAPEPQKGKKPPLILVAESSFSVRRNLVVGLSQQDFSVLYSTNSEDTQTLITGSHPDLVVVNPISLEWLTPDGSRPPYVVIAPANSGNIDAMGIKVLNEGADFFLPEPVAPDFLAAHIRASLRTRKPLLDSKEYKIDDLTISPGLIQKNGRKIMLTGTESALLLALVRNRGTALKHNDSLVSISGYRNTRTSDGLAYLHVYVSRVRRKLKEIGAGNLIKSIKKVGYMVEAPVGSLQKQEEETAQIPKPSGEIEEVRIEEEQGSTEVFVPFVEGKNGVRVDFEKDTVTKNGKLVRLTRTEWRLLAFLGRNHGRVISHNEILSDVWGPPYAEDPDLARTVIHRLRDKVENNPENPQVIKTIKGLGYIFPDQDQTFKIC